MWTDGWGSGRDKDGWRGRKDRVPEDLGLTVGRAGSGWVDTGNPGGIGRREPGMELVAKAAVDGRPMRRGGGPRG